MEKSFLAFPFRVVYAQCDGWHEKSSPRVVDARMREVCSLPQFVEHPGLYDAHADAIARYIAWACNRARKIERADLNVEETPAHTIGD